MPSDLRPPCLHSSMTNIRLITALIMFGLVLVVPSPSQCQRLNDQVLTAYRVKLINQKPPKGTISQRIIFDPRTKTYPLDQYWIGARPSDKDFSGHFRLGYTKDSLVIEATIVDDILFDGRPDPLEKYWDDDCLEIFLDPDASGGPHQYNHNAWAYHIALDHTCVDFGPSEKPAIYPHAHTQTVVSKLPNGSSKTVWTVKVAMHKDNYQDAKLATDQANKAIQPTKQKRIGFALAYCDNDSSPERENFIGSVPVPGQDKNQGYKNAWIFGLLEFK